MGTREELRAQFSRYMSDEIAARDRTIASLTAEVERLKKLLKKLEWSRGPGFGSCPNCFAAAKWMTHAHDCELAILVGSKRKEPDNDRRD